MKTSSLLFRSIAVLGLAVFAGCQTSPDSGDVSLAPASSGADEELRLVVKDDPSCLEILGQVKAGEGGDSLRAAFLEGCVVEIPPGQPLPPRPLPGPGLRCEWAQGQIDSGRIGLIPAFARHCTEVCDSLSVSDSSAFGKYCVPPPRPAPPPRDTVGPVKPPLPPARQARCDSLQAVLSGLDTASIDYPHFVRHVAAVCKLPPPPRPLPPSPPPAPPEVCARQAAHLATLAPGTPAHANLSAHHALVCPVADPSGSGE